MMYYILYILNTPTEKKMSFDMGWTAVCLCVYLVYCCLTDAWKEEEEGKGKRKDQEVSSLSLVCLLQGRFCTPTLQKWQKREERVMLCNSSKGRIGDRERKGREICFLPLFSAVPRLKGWKKGKGEKESKSILLSPFIQWVHGKSQFSRKKWEGKGSKWLRLSWHTKNSLHSHRK